MAHKTEIIAVGTEILLGNIANTHISMNTVDIGLAQLAMHSCYETAGVQDVAFLIKAMQVYYGLTPQMQTDGAFSLNG